MATTLTQIGEAVSFKTDLFIKIVGAVVAAAGAIRTELVSTPNHDNRVIWAKEVAGGAVGMAQLFLLRLLQETNVQNAIGGDPVTDPQIQAAIDSVVDEFAIGG